MRWKKTVYPKTLISTANSTRSSCKIRFSAMARFFVLDARLSLVGFLSRVCRAKRANIFRFFLANFIIFEYRENSTVITNGEFRLHIVRVRNILHLFHLSDTRRPFDHLISCVFLLLLSPLSENTMSFEYKRSVRKLKWNEKVMELKIFMS